MARKKKSSIVQAIVLIIAGYFIYSWYQDLKPNINPPANQSPTAQTVQTAAIKAAVSRAEAYASQPVKNNWPPVARQGSKVYTDAAKLLTTNYYVMLDASGSMADQKCSGNVTKMQVAAQALGKFAQSVPTDANFGLAIFNGAVTSKELIPLGSHRLNVAQVAASIVPTATTPLASAMEFSYKKITEQAQRQLGYGDYYLVMLTDGIADKGQEADRIVPKILSESPIQIYTIGFCISENHSLNQPGRTVYRSANDPQSLQQGLQDVLAESPDFNVADFSAEQ